MNSIIGCGSSTRCGQESSKTCGKSYIGEVYNCDKCKIKKLTEANKILIEYYKASREMYYIGHEDVSVDKEQKMEIRYTEATKAAETLLKGNTQ